MDPKKLAVKIRELADNKKAENIAVLDVRGLNSVTDYFVVATGLSEPHVRAIVHEITDQLWAEAELRPRALDGQIPTAWMVLDYVDVIVHVMRPEVRAKYDLEGLWGDAPKIKPARRKTASKSAAK